MPDKSEVQEPPERIWITSNAVITNGDGSRRIGHASCVNEFPSISVEYVRADLATVVPLPKWRSMDTAPKDGTRIRVRHASSKVSEAVYVPRKDIWVSPDGAYGYDPTGWLPLPQPEEAQETGLNAAEECLWVKAITHGNCKGEIRHKDFACDAFLCLPELRPEHYTLVSVTLTRNAFENLIAVLASPSAGYREAQNAAAAIAESWEDEKSVNPARAIARAIRELKPALTPPQPPDEADEVAQQLYDALTVNDDINTWHKETLMLMITKIISVLEARTNMSEPTCMRCSQSKPGGDALPFCAAGRGGTRCVFPEPVRQPTDEEKQDGLG